MAYDLRRYKKKDGTEGFKIAFVTSDGGKRKYQFIKQADWGTLEISPHMPLEQVKERIRALNRAARHDYHEKRKVGILERLGAEEDTHLIYLGKERVAEFEQTRLFGRDVHPRDKRMSYWRTAKRIICELKLPIADWEEEATRFYDWFRKHEYSVAYAAKVIPILNRWGIFLARKAGSPFLPIPFPKGRERNRINDAYFERTTQRQGNVESLPITPSRLEAKRSALRPDHYNWIYLSVWFGLRPGEVDALKNPSHYRLSEAEGVPVLEVYQSKLGSIDHKKRWKPIPCIRPEQVAGLEILRGQLFRRPLAKTMSSHFGPKHTQYAGRKGFTDLMLGFGQTLEDISVWMGHTNVQRTWESYKNKQKVKFTKVA